MKRVMVTGSRTFGVCDHPPGTHRGGCRVRDEQERIMISALQEHVQPLGFPVELIHGDARGADKLAAALWSRYGLGPTTAFPADWSELGKRAGHVRNEILINHMPDLVLAFHLDNSPGTADAIRQAKAAGLTVHVYSKEN